MEMISAVYSASRVVVPAMNEANSLYQDGYGSLLDGSLLTLKPYEVLYLVERTRLSVVDESTRRKATFQELTWRFSDADPHIWTRYIVYRDLRGRGFVAREGPGLGVDFLVYERGSYGKRPPKSVIYAIWEGSPESIEHLCHVLENVDSEGRVLRIAVVDRRGEVVYYTLSETDFSAEEDEDLP